MRRGNLLLVVVAAAVLVLAVRVLVPAALLSLLPMARLPLPQFLRRLVAAAAAIKTDG